MPKCFTIKVKKNIWYAEGQLVAELVVVFCAVIAVTSILLYLFGFINRVVRFDALSTDIARTAITSSGQIAVAAEQRLNQELELNAMRLAWCTVEVEEKIVTEFPIRICEITFRLKYGPMKPGVQIYKGIISFPTLTKVKRFQITKPN